MLPLELVGAPADRFLALLELGRPRLQLGLALGDRAAGCMRLLAQDLLALECGLQLTAHRIELGHGALHDHVDGRRDDDRDRLHDLRLDRAAVLGPLELRTEAGAESLLGLVRHLNAFRIVSIAGPSTTMNIDGKMKITVGKSILIGAFIAFSSAAA